MKNIDGKKVNHKTFFDDVSKLDEERRPEYMDREDIFIKNAKKSYEAEYLPKNLGLHHFRDSAVRQVTNFILNVILSKKAMWLYSSMIFGYITYIGYVYFVCVGYPSKPYLCGNYKVHLEDFKTLVLIIIGIIGGKVVKNKPSHIKRK